MELSVVQVGDPVLRHPASEVEAAAIASPFVQDLIASMVDTMRGMNAVGLAAPQVGESLRIVVMEDRPEAVEKLSESRRDDLGRVPFPARTLINPTLTKLGDDHVAHFESCLSIPGLEAMVPRWKAVRVNALDHHG